MKKRESPSLARCGLYRISRFLAFVRTYPYESFGGGEGGLYVLIKPL